MPRLHRRDGSFIGLGRLPYGLYSAWQAVLRKSLGLYPSLPWIPFQAIARLDGIIKLDWSIYEFGSGKSTAWLAKRSAHVISYEADETWFKRLRHEFARDNITNVDLRYEWRGHIMSQYENVSDESLDLLYIDGGPRGDCLIAGFDKVKIGGFIYLDNWDSGHFWSNHMGDAKKFLSDKPIGTFESELIEDYVPGMPTIQQSLLIRRLA